MYIEDRTHWRFGTAMAAFAAGPIFVTAMTLASLYKTLPAPIIIDPRQGVAFVALLVIALIFGTIIGALPILLGAAIMVMAGKTAPFCRAPAAWIACGGAMATAILAFTGTGMPETAFALVVTAMLCAAICRHWVTWAD